MLLLLLALASPASRSIGQEGLLAHYTFDEGSGELAADDTGKGHEGTIVGAVHVESPRGYALRFDGEGDYVDIGRADDLNVQGDLTLEAWVKPAKIDGRNRMLVGDAAGRTLNRNWNWRIDREQMRFEHADGDQYGVILADAKPLVDGEWHHVALICESPRYFLYLDGTRVQTGDLAIPITPTRGANRRIGGWGPGWFDGEIDEVWIWDRAVPERTIASHAVGEDAPPEPALEVTPKLIYSQQRVFAAVLLGNAEYAPGRARVRVTRGEDVAARAEGDLEETSSGSERWATTVELGTKGMAAGAYQVEATAGGLTATVDLEIPERPAWFESKVGTADKVMPPFTPVELRKTDGKARVGVWGREYRFGASPFLSGIESQGEELLTGPMRLEATADGTKLALGATTAERGAAAEGKLTVRAAGKTRAKLRREWAGGGLGLRVATEVEYDGFARLDWALRAEEAVTLEGLAMEIPLRSEHATLLYTWDKVRSGELRDDYASPFLPLVWLGDEERGLQWLCESSMNWYLEGKGQAIQVLRRGDEVLLRLTLIDRPVELAKGEELEYTFGFYATPAKPVEQDMWDQRMVRHPWYGYGLDIPDKELEGKPALQHFQDVGARALLLCRIWDAFAYPLPLGHEPEFRRLVDECHKHDLKVVPYVGGFLFSERAPEAGFVGEMMKWPVAPYPIDRLPGLESQMTHIVCQRSSWQDFLVDGCARLIEEHDADGIYLDSTTIPWACSSPYHGCRHVDREGRLAPTYPLFDVRETMKRLYTAVRERKPDGMVDLHVYDCMHGPAVGFATSYWNGEQLGRGTKVKVKGLPLDRFRAEFMGTNWGAAADMLYYILGGYRQCQAIAHLHDVPVRPENDRNLAIHAAYWDLREEFGVKEAEWLPYWRNSEQVSVAPDGCHASVWRRPEGRALAIVSNLTEEAAEVQVNLAGLGLEGDLQAREPLLGTDFAVDGAMVTVPVTPQDWRAVWIDATRG